DLQSGALGEREIVGHGFVCETPVRLENFFEAKSLRRLRPVKRFTRDELVAIVTLAPERIAYGKKRGNSIGIVKRAENRLNQLRRRERACGVVNEHSLIRKQIWRSVLQICKHL